MLQGIGFNNYSSSISKTLTKQTSKLNDTLNKLATGSKVNKAADDAAGMSIAETLSTSIRGYSVAEKNIGDAISMIQTAESGLSGISDNLQRIRELAVQAGNGTLSGTEKQAIQDEIDARLDNIDDISSSTSFNGKKLLDGSSGNVTIQTGSEVTDTSTVNLSSNFSSSASTTAGSGNINEGNTGGSAGTALNNIDVVNGNLDDIITGIDNALDNVTSAQSSLGADENGLTSKLENISIQKEAAYASRSKIMDEDYASGSSNLVKDSILQSFAASLSKQSNLNARLALNLLPS